MALKGKSKGGKAKKAMTSGASTASDWASPRLDSAKYLARAKATEARNWAAPRLESAAGTVNTEVVPRVRGVLDQAAEAAGPTFEEAKSRGTRAVAALRGVDVPPPPKKKKKRGRKVLLVLLSVAVAGGVAAAVWTRRNADGFDYYSLPADDFGQGEHNTNGALSRYAQPERADSDPGQPAMPSTDPEAAESDGAARGEGS